MSEGSFWSDAYAQSSDSNDHEAERQAAQDAADRADGAALRKLRERYREATIYYQADLPCPYEVDFPGGEVQAPTLPEAAEKAVGFVVYVPTAAESVLG